MTVIREAHDRNKGVRQVEVRGKDGPQAEAEGRREIVLSVRNLKKKAGSRWIIRGISFDVHAGEIFGFLGPNGSGKTTTIRMLADLIRPTEGTVTICSRDLAKERNAALAKAGFIVENPEMYPFLTGRENLRHFARMTPGVDDRRIAEVTALVGLERRIDDKVKTYSLGMRQRLGIAQALLSDPKLLILDEPTNGLDPQGIRELRLFLRDLADRGIGIVISSHLLSEIELMCDRVAIISGGETIAVGGVAELLAQASGGVLLAVGDARRAADVLAEAGVQVDVRTGDDAGIATREANPGQSAGTSGTVRREQPVRGEPANRHLPDPDRLADRAESGGEAAGEADRPAGSLFVRAREEDVPGIVRLLVGRGIDVYAVERHKPTLEDLFIAMTGGGGIA
jgi:ABC-2 type transport system ATP-binding protein